MEDPSPRRPAQSKARELGHRSVDGLASTVGRAWRRNDRLMRYATLMVPLLLFAPRSARAENHVDAPKHTLRGHTFMTPAGFESAFLETTFTNRISARREAVGDVPIGNLTTDVNALGVREALSFELALGERWAVGANALAQFLTGTSAQALATQGLIYAYRVSANAAFRILRIDDSGTQLSVRVQAFGVQDGSRLSLVPVLVAVRNEPLRSIPDIITSFGGLLRVPVSLWGFAGAVTVAQVISPATSVQGSFRLSVSRFTQSPFVPGGAGSTRARPV